MGGELTPWWIGITTGVVTAAAGVIGKVWTELRRELRDTRAELAAANARVVELQQLASKRGDELQREHVRDLRRFAGVSTSLEPPAHGGWPPAIVREQPPRIRKPRKKGPEPPT